MSLHKVPRSIQSVPYYFYTLRSISIEDTSKFSLTQSVMEAKCTTLSVDRRFLGNPDNNFSIDSAFKGWNDIVD